MLYNYITAHGAINIKLYNTYSVHYVVSECKFIQRYNSTIIIWCFFDHASYYRLISITNLMHKFFYSITVCMLHYNPRHVSSINMPIFRRKNYIITASGIVTLCKCLYSMLSSGILYSHLQRVTIPDPVIIQFVLLKMGTLMLETRGLYCNIHTVIE